VARVSLHARDVRFWLAPLAFLLAVSLWLAPMLLAGLATGSDEYRAYMDDILFQQTARRYTQSGTITSPVVLLATMPLDVDPGVPGAALGDSGLAPPAAPPRRALPAAAGLVAAGGAVLLDPHGKRDVYILPALPMFCLALAPLLPGC
jgi:4-amino-4-deoxy-L-arabinose transferase-like glycosyltransferase